MMINKEIYLARSWKVNKIADDFTLWDVWEIPIIANNSKTENFQSFYGVVLETFNKIQTSTSLTSFLFALRFWLNKIFPLDNNVNTLPIPGCRETSVKSRLNAQELEQSKVGKTFKDNNTNLEFRAVYLYDDESLHEISNDTVHALMHVGWIKKNENHYTATLAIYVIPRGLLGKAYLKFIEPFRHIIVYPAMMKAIKAQWNEYLLRNKMPA
jgi:hypothetical protein